jgi:hypothetical protein
MGLALTREGSLRKSLDHTLLVKNDGLNLLSTALHDITQISPFRLIFSYNTDIHFWM